MHLSSLYFLKLFYKITKNKQNYIRCVEKQFRGKTKLLAKHKVSKTRNSSGDEIANVNFFATTLYTH